MRKVCQINFKIFEKISNKNYQKFDPIKIFLENENSVMEFMESMNSLASPSELKNYRMSMNHVSGSSSNPKQLGKNRSNNLDSSAIGINNMPQQSRTKKLGAIMGIAKRSRSIHNPDWCPSKSFNSLFRLNLQLCYDVHLIISFSLLVFKHLPKSLKLLV